MIDYKESLERLERRKQKMDVKIAREKERERRQKRKIAENKT